MSPELSGLTIVVLLVVLLATGMPIAFALGLSAVTVLVLTEGVSIFGVLAETMFAGIASLAYVAVPMFVLMGAAIASSPAGRDLYEALDRWLNRVPGGLVMSNIGACAIFAGMTGSSPATCAAIGKMGIPEMMKRGYPGSVATGSIAAGGTLGILIPPSVTMIVYGIATETSIGRLFLAGVLPGIMLVGLFMAWTIYSAWRSGTLRNLSMRSYTLSERLEILPRVLPFMLIIAGVLYAMYGGVATASETAAVGALLALVLAMVIYRMWQPRVIWNVFRDSTKEAVMIMFIIAAAGVFAYMMSSLFITQTIAQWIAGLDVNRWVLMGIINLFLLVAGFFLPPVAVIVMTAPILMPILTAANFDPYWFAVILTINMEIGLITPPVGLNLYVINSIAPDISLKTVLVGSIPYVLCMVAAIVILCIFPGIATWLPDLMMGPAI